MRTSAKMLFKILAITDDGEYWNWFTLSKPFSAEQTKVLLLQFLIHTLFTAFHRIVYTG